MSLTSVTVTPQFHRSTHQICHRTPGTDGLPFLDTLSKPTSNSIESTIYRKPTHADRYLGFNSNHLISAKLSVIHTLIHRVKQVCSIENKVIFFQTLYWQKREFPRWDSNLTPLICRTSALTARPQRIPVLPITYPSDLL